MRRLLAILVLTVISAGFLSPLVLAAELSAVPSCCLRNGKHRCHQDPTSSGELSFRAARGVCPYSVPITVARFESLNAVRFNLDVPENVTFLSGTTIECEYQVASPQRWPRGPPSDLTA
jgi:hypothetical protein